MASPAVTYTFTNSTVADATQVNTNFSNIIDALTDGTKSLSIDALTCAGAVTLNGTVALGNATSDDVTITGYVASAIIPKTTDTYALGSTSLLYSVLYATKILAGDGSAATPAYSFNSTGNGDNGMYLSAANELSFATAGSQRVVIDSSGEVGIGTASPTEICHVYVNGATANIVVENNSTAADNTAALIARGRSDYEAKLGVIQNDSVAVIAGFIQLANGATSYYLWVDSSGKLRISTTAADRGGTGGTVVGTQS